MNIAYVAFECEALSPAETRGISIRVRKIKRARSVLTLAIFLGAMLISLRFPLCGFGLICCVLFAYLRPKAPSVHVADARHPRDTIQKTDAIR